MSLLLFTSLASPPVLPVVPQPAVVTSAFSALVASADRAIMSALGGSTIVYQPAVGAAVNVTGIFEARFLLAQGDAQTGVETFGPAVFLRLEDLPVDPENDDPTLTIAGSPYRVVERIRDDMGGIVLALRLIL